MRRNYLDAIQASDFLDDLEEDREPDEDDGGKDDAESPDDDGEPSPTAA